MYSPFVLVLGKVRLLYLFSFNFFLLFFPFAYVAVGYYWAYCTASARDGADYYIYCGSQMAHFVPSVLTSFAQSTEAEVWATCW